MFVVALVLVGCGWAPCPDGYTMWEDQVCHLDEVDTEDSGSVIDSEGDTEDSSPPNPELPAYDDPTYVQVGSFNVDWLSDSYGTSYVPRNAMDYEMIAQLIVEYDLDLLGMQEINTEAALALLPLPETYSYVVSASGVSQNTAILYRNDQFTIDNVREIELPGTNTYARDPLIADVRAIDGDLSFTFIVVHMKSGDGTSDTNTRVGQIQDLHDWIVTDHAAAAAGSDFEEVIVVGDFNETLEGDGDSVPLSIFSDDSSFYTATADLDTYTFIPSHSQLDHLFLTQDLESAYLGPEEGAGCQASPFDKMDPYRNYTGGYGDEQNISSHRPVWAYFQR